MGCSNANAQRWTVVDVHDGDTIRIERAGTTEKVRFACIDAPELAQPLGKASRDHLRMLINQADGQVQVKIMDTDRYGRRVAEVFTRGQKFLQAEQAQAGMAYVYDQYLKNCPDAATVQQAQKIAQQQKLGVWQRNYQKPWEYRKRQRS
ncbi:thermonuclease family protein [Leptolyngbya sp. FACHB-261]|nr:thermonuclease family protein [Leptolyngbya sp. FACHB-261]